MKWSIVIVLWFCVVNVQAQTFYVNVESKVFRDAVVQYIEEVDFKIDDKYGYLIIKLVNISGEDLLDKPTKTSPRGDVGFQIDTLGFHIQSFHHLVYLQDKPPLAYSLINNVPVLFYSGLERLISIRNNKKFIKAMIPYTVPKRRPTMKLSAAWSVYITGDKIDYKVLGIEDFSELRY